jgi:hypothetical protein
MHQPHERGNLENTTQRGHEHQRVSSSVQSEDYDGENAESGYDQAIFDLLKDPVSLGMRGSNSNRGRQR